MELEINIVVLPAISPGVQIILFQDEYLDQYWVYKKIMLEQWIAAYGSLTFENVSFNFKLRYIRDFLLGKGYILMCKCYIHNLEMNERIDRRIRTTGVLTIYCSTLIFLSKTMVCASSDSDCIKYLCIWLQSPEANNFSSKNKIWNPILLK